MHAAAGGDTADEGEGEGGPIVLYSPRDDDASQCDGDSQYHVQHDEAGYVSYQQQQHYSSQQQQQQQYQQQYYQQHDSVHCDRQHDSTQQQQHVDSFDFVYSGQQGPPWGGGSVAGSATDRQQQQCWDDADDDSDSIAVDTGIDAGDSVSSRSACSTSSAAAGGAAPQQSPTAAASSITGTDHVQHLIIDVDGEAFSSQQQQQLIAELAASTSKSKRLSGDGQRAAYDAPRSPIG
jgi:hypothetical protein